MRNRNYSPASGPQNKKETIPNKTAGPRNEKRKRPTNTKKRRGPVAGRAREPEIADTINNLENKSEKIKKKGQNRNLKNGRNARSSSGKNLDRQTKILWGENGFTGCRLL